jgi:tetratricopeptide (TPR) repeat protein
MANPGQQPRLRFRAVLLTGMILAATGLVAALGGPWYREQRLQRMDVATLRAWTERRPDDAPGHFYLALTLGRAGDRNGAQRELERALELDPGLSSARWRLARMQATAGQADAAARLLREGLRLDPSAAPLHAELGRLDERSSSFRQAAVAWERAAALAPRDAEAWYHLGRCRMSLNDDTGALAAYRRAAALSPGSATVEKALGAALRLQRQYGEAERHSRRALALAPTDPEAQLGLARLLWDRDGPTPEAQASLKRAVDLQPQNPLLRYSLATLERERGHLDAAAREYRETLRLLERAPPPPAASDWDERERWLSQLEGPHFYLAQILRQSGRAAEADRHLACFRRISDYRNRARQLVVRLANRPGDAALRRELARLHAAHRAPHLAEVEVRAAD